MSDDKKFPVPYQQNDLRTLPSTGLPTDPPTMVRGFLALWEMKLADMVRGKMVANATKQRDVEQLMNEIRAIRITAAEQIEVIGHLPVILADRRHARETDITVKREQRELNLAQLRLRNSYALDDLKSELDGARTDRARQAALNAKKHENEMRALEIEAQRQEREPGRAHENASGHKSDLAQRIEQEQQDEMIKWQSLEAGRSNMKQQPWWPELSPADKDQRLAELDARTRAVFEQFRGNRSSPKDGDAFNET